jgi:very-short-patch-repair endonuclease
MAVESRVLRAGPDKVDVRLARLAAIQWSVVDTADLRACGLSADAIATRVANGRLFRVHRGVYAVIPNVTVEGVFLAAVKACGPGAVLSHFSAAVLHGWFEWDGRYPEVTVGNPRKHAGIRSHRSKTIERVVVRGIPVTPPVRTVIDLSAQMPYAGVRRAMAEGLSRGQFKASDFVTGRHRGAAKLRRILATAAPTRNEYEDVVNEVIRLAGLPAPDVNLRRGRYIPDFRWPQYRVILEADSRRYHGHLLARADDRRRQASLEAQGELVVRTTWHEIVSRPNAMVARVREAIESRVVRPEPD